MTSRKSALAILASLALLGAGCGGDTPTSPSDSTLPTVTDTFTGTIATNGAAVHAFSVKGTGTVTATLTGVALESGATPPVIGFSLGYVNGLVCSAVVSNDFASQNAVLTGRTTVPATLCVRVFDVVGLITDPVTYTLEVKHP